MLPSKTKSLRNYKLNPNQLDGRSPELRPPKNSFCTDPDLYHPIRKLRVLAGSIVIHLSCIRIADPGPLTSKPDLHTFPKILSLLGVIKLIALNLENLNIIKSKGRVIQYCHTSHSDELQICRHASLQLCKLYITVASGSPMFV